HSPATTVDFPEPLDVPTTRSAPRGRSLSGWGAGRDTANHSDGPAAAARSDGRRPGTAPAATRRAPGSAGDGPPRGRVSPGRDGLGGVVAHVADEVDERVV